MERLFTSACFVFVTVTCASESVTDACCDFVANTCAFEVGMWTRMRAVFLVASTVASRSVTSVQDLGLTCSTVLRLVKSYCCVCLRGALSSARRKGACVS